VGLYFVKMHGLAPGPLPWLRKLRARVAAKQSGGIALATASAIEMQSRHACQDVDDATSSLDRSAKAGDALARLGKVLNWLGLTIGFLSGAWVLVCIATLFGAFGYTDTFATTALLVGGVVVGFFAWIAGRAALYVFAGR
jgi:phage tail tape-measure protein